ncbi:hypothetical protein LAZ67_1001763 [Cordylochernes scorpioides]|uniref:Transposase n=1 Tax=Cordylochernes scorpioides TaxID=51811 RepID=A0ABY6JWH1_9ARAC|nr:hypothetical protein LAZ67_1001763 [Cordylochernes scorpioides]
MYGYDPETKRQSSQCLEPGEPRFKKARMIKSKLKEAVRQKRPEKWYQKNWLLHHDNARAHTAVTVQLYLAKHGIALLPQLPYSPDLSPNDFFLYPKIKKVFKRRRFDSIPEIKENAKDILKSLKDEDFQRCFDIWKKRWNKCIDSNKHPISLAENKPAATRDLRLSKQDAELLASTLNKMSQLEDDVNVTFYRTRESSFLPFYQQDSNLVYCTNTKRYEWEAIKKLKNNDDIVITRADKGGKTVVMKKEDYNDKIKSLLNDTNTYEEIREDPTKKIKLKISKFIKNMKSKDIDKRKMKLEDVAAPLFKGLPKIHKEGVPLRPIVSGFKAPTPDV